MANWLMPLLGGLAWQMKRRFVRQTLDPLATQTDFLLKLLGRYAGTQLGQAYNLATIDGVNAFRDRIPVLPYSAYEPYTERIFQGEANVLTPDPVCYLNLTSGSTGVQKLIPVTQRFQNSLRRANLTSIGFLSEQLNASGQSLGKLLLTNSAEVLGTTPGGIPYGPASVGVLQMGQWLYEQLFVQPFASLQIADSRSRHYVCLLFALLNSDLRGIAANFPMLILRIGQYLDDYGAEMVADLERGELAAWLQMDLPLRSQLQGQMRSRCRPERVARLRQILKIEGRLLPGLVWPHLGYVATARGGTSDFYFQRFPDYFGTTPGFGAVYSSAEGTFSIYPDFNKDGSILAIETGFFEFVPPSQWDQPHPRTLLAHEVIPGEFYRLLMTNYSGFYRYDIGDVVEVVGFYHATPMIVFRYRQGGLLSSTSEKTTEYHVTQVMQHLQQSLGIKLEDFCITLAEQPIPSPYLVNIELCPGAAVLEDPIGFLQTFDHTLQQLHRSYQIKRSDVVPAPHLRLLAPGSFAVVRQRQVEKGIPDSQLKFPHLSEDRNFLAGLTVLQQWQLSGVKPGMKRR
jgi:hypothetical protein